MAGLVLALASAVWAAETAVAPAVEAAAPAAYKSAAGPREVQSVTFDWADVERSGRVVPVRIYMPKGDPERLPVVVFSHGLGGSRDGYAYLGNHWASHGYVSVHLQHVGSDTGVWQGQVNPMAAMREAITARAALDRFADVRFVVDRLAAADKDVPQLAGRVDIARLGMAGHSFGAHTTLGIAGQTRPGVDGSAADRRFKAAIAMSPQAQPGVLRLDEAYKDVRIPMFHMTGTEDSSVVNDTKPAERRVPYDHIRGADQFLLILKGGDHMIFSGRPRISQAKATDARFTDLIRQSTTAFWDAYLKDDAAALAWFVDGGFTAVLADDGTFKMCLVKPAAAPEPVAAPASASSSAPAPAAAAAEGGP
jgi:predicted dienelactone hydrolase